MTGAGSALLSSSKLKWLALGAVLFLGAVLRLSEIGHGQSFHPDERHIVMVTESLSLSNLNPKSFAYGSFPYYVVWIASSVLGLFSEYYAQYDGIFIVGRVCCSLFGLLGIYLTYVLAKEIYNSALAGIVAAAFLSFNVLHLQLSRFFTSDVILTTICTGALICMIKILKEGNLHWYILTGLLLGVGIATKISAVFLGAPLALVLLFRYLYFEKELSVKFLACVVSIGALAAVTFVLVEPYAILDFETFWANTREQTSMARGLWRPPYTIQYMGTIPYLYHFEQMYYYTIGAPIFLLCLAALLWRAARRPSQAELVVLLWIATVVFLVAGMQVKYPRYLLPIYPELFVLLGGAFSLVFGGRVGEGSCAPAIQNAQLG